MGVKGKNIRVLLGKPLLHHSLEHAKSWFRTSAIYLSTDSPEIAECAARAGIRVSRLRHEELSGDAVGKLAVIRDAVAHAEKDHGERYDYVVDLDVTSPLRTVDDIEGAYQESRRSGHDVTVSVCESRRNPYFNMVETHEGHARLCKALPANVLSRQSAPRVYDLNASIYVYRRSFFDKEENYCIGKSTGIYVMPSCRSWDVDHEEDFHILEALMRYNRTKDPNGKT